jgi:hypothetical protein
METKKRSFLVHDRLYKGIMHLPDDEIGKLFRALHEYHMDGEVKTDLPPEVDIIFRFYRLQMDEDNQLYQDKCDRNRHIAFKRWSKERKKGKND